MKTSDPPAYSKLLAIDLTTPSALGESFRGLFLSTTTSGTITFTITNEAGTDVTGVRFALVANQTEIFPISGTNILKTAGGTNYVAYGLV